MRRRIQPYAQNTDGSTMPVFALSLMAIMALVGATIALGMDSRAANNLQATADSAALSGATAFINVSSPKAEDRLSEAQRLAKQIAESNSEYVLANLNVDAVTEDAYGQHTRIDVEMTFEPVNAMAKIAGRNANVAITRRAAAEATWGFPLCILGLRQGEPAISTADNAKLIAENCVIWSNSKETDSLDFNGGDIKTKHLCAAGKASIGLGAKVEPLPAENCSQIPDPLYDWRPPPAATIYTKEDELSVGDIDAALAAIAMIVARLIENITSSPDQLTTQNAIEMTEAQIESVAPVMLDEDKRFTLGPAKGYTIGELLQLAGDVDNVDPMAYADDDYFSSPTLTISPGTYAGLDIAEGHIKMLPGVYHIVDNPLIVRRRATLTGEGVTIILHGEGATFGVLDEARLTLTAPVDGPTAGFALAENRYEDAGDEPQRSRLTGEGRIEMIGTVYLPRQVLSITGEGDADQSSPLLQIVADFVDMTDRGRLKIVFDTSKTDIPVAIKPERTARLVN